MCVTHNKLAHSLIIHRQAVGAREKSNHEWEEDEAGEHLSTEGGGGSNEEGSLSAEGVGLVRDLSNVVS